MTERRRALRPWDRRRAHRREAEGKPMRFMMFVKASPDSEAGKMPSQALISEMMRFNEELVKAGVLLDGAGLQSSAKGVRRKFSRGTSTLVEGPFPETRQLVSG